MKVDFCLSALPLTGSAARMECCRDYESTHERGKRVCAACVERQQSPDRREVINICMTAQMTSYFHGNMLVSSEVSGGDGYCGCVNMYISVYSCQYLDFDRRAENTSDLRGKTG